MGTNRSYQPKLLLQGRPLDEIQLREILCQIVVAFPLDSRLVGACTSRRALPVSGEELVDDVHAGNDLAERRKPLIVEPRIIPEIDEDLGGARIRPRCGKRDVAALVALLDLVVLDRRGAPAG